MLAQPTTPGIWASLVERATPRPPSGPNSGDQPKAARNCPLHVGALGAPDGPKALEGLTLVFKPEE